MATPRGTVFLHLPKTAGTSLNQLLNVAFPEGRISPPLSSVALSADDAAQLDAYELITGHLSWSDVSRHLPGRRLFTVLREPVSRCLSLYTFLKGHVSLPLIPLGELAGRNDFIEATSIARQVEPQDFFAFASSHPAVRQAVANRMVWQLGDHSRPECRRLACDDAALEQALRNLDQFCFVTVLERLDDDLSELLETIGVSVPCELPRSNAAAAPLGRGDVGSDTLRAIERITGCDRRLYDAVVRRADGGDAVRPAA